MNKYKKNGIDIMTLGRNEWLKLAIKELSIGRRIREELRIQCRRRKPGRAVLWRRQPGFAKRLFLLLKPRECADK